MVAHIAANAGHNLSPTTAREIAEALLGYATHAHEIREAVPREAWEQPAYREHIRTVLRRKLAEEVADRGTLPVALPSEATRYLTSSLSEVPADIVEQGAPYERVELALAVPVRRYDRP